MRNLLVAPVVVALSVLLGGCESAATEDEKGSASNAITDAPRAGEDGRDGYLELQHITNSTVPVDEQYIFVAHDADGALKDGLRPGDWITATIPADVAADLAAGGQLLASVHLFYRTGGTETNRDERSFSRQPDGSYAVKSFTIPGTAAEGPDTLSANLTAMTTAKRPEGGTFAARSWSELTILRETSASAD